MNPSNVSVRYITTFSDDVIAGGFVLAISLTGLGPYCFCMALVLLARDMRKMPFYQYILSLGVSDISTLIGWVLLGIHLITNGLEVPSFLVSTGIHLVSLGWETGSVHILLISFHRYCSISNWKLEKIFFKQRIKHWMYIAIIWIPCVFHQSLIVRGSTFIMDGHYIVYGQSNSGMIYFMWDGIKNIFVVTISIACYASIILTQRESARKIAAHKRAKKNQAEPDKQQKEKQAAQIRLAVQTGIVFGIFAYADVSYWIVTFVRTPKWVNYFFSTFSWALSCTSNPFVYFTFNKAIAKELQTRTSRFTSRFSSKTGPTSVTGTQWRGPELPPRSLL